MSYLPHLDPKVGCINRLKIIQKTSAGLVLQGEVLLPTRGIPKSIAANIGDSLDVFVYMDAQERLTATTQKPYTEVGRFADLQVVEISDHGIFLDWGLPKDLLLPFNEEVGTLKVDDFAIVYTYIDDRSQRIVATMKLEKHVDQTPHNYKEGDEVSLLIESKTPLGLKAIVNHGHWGLIFRSDIIGDVHVGDEVEGFIKTVRPDGKLDISMQPAIKTHQDRNSLEDKILQKLEANGGLLYLTDKSSPDEIYKAFGVSKGVYKRAIGGLFKAKKIIISKESIQLS